MSFCADRIGHLYASDPRGSVKFEFTDFNEIRQYSHGTGTAMFVVCSADMTAVREIMEPSTL